MTDQQIAGRARALAEALAEAGFARLRVRDGDLEIEVRRSAHTAAAAEAPPAEDERRIEASDEVIASDVVGIVHLLRPPLVEGQEFDGDRELAYVETLGIRNPVRSRGPGRIRSVLVGEGEPVEFGQALFTVERTP
jgi:acetyl-CoA carboxylase biotin carboxyl carrier protein